MSLNLDRELRKQAQVKKRKGGFTWKPESGENIIRVFKFSHKVTKQDVNDGLFDKDQLGKTIEDWDRELQVEFKGKGEEVPKLSYRYALNIVDLNKEGEKSVETWLAPVSVREQIGAYVTDNDYGEEILGCSGRDFKITFDKDLAPAKMYSVILRDSKHCKELDRSLESDVRDFYNSSVYETLGGVDEKNNPGQEDVKTKKSAKDEDDELE